MKTINNMLVILAGMMVIAAGYVIDMIESALEGSWLGYVVDGAMIAALFFGIMQLLKWAVWVLE